MAKPSRRQKTFLFFVALTVYTLFTGLLLRDRYIDLTNLPSSDVTPHIAAPKPKEEVVLPPVIKDLPLEANIQVPFMVQAPFANWDALHEETCEEASLLMVKYFRSKQAFGLPAAQDDELKSLVAWETKAGYEVDVTVLDLAKIARDYFSMTSGRVIKDPTVENLKAEIAAGRPIIVPAAGRLLENPYFSGGGPPYHMIVLKGYDEKGFIAHDPGTRRGENFRYSFANIMDALHDWTGSTTTITAGQKAVLVFD